MFRQSMYSKYQKRAIRFLTDYLGTETPFTYEKTQANHLKVLIDGVPKPIYTGSTPSDRKSINNFMAEIKRELKASKLDLTPVENIAPKMVLASTNEDSHEKLVENAIKAIRSRLGVIKSKEQEQVIENKSLDAISDYRNDVIKNTISLASQARKPSIYIKHQEMKIIEHKVLKHLNFLMPTLAHYSELLDGKSKYKKTKPEIETLEKTLNTQILSPNAVKAEENNKATLIDAQVAVAFEQLNETISPNNKTKVDSEGAASELMALSANKRINLLRKLTKTQIMQLTEDVMQAEALNREQDIAEVVALIKEKGVDLNAIIAQLG